MADERFRFRIRFNVAENHRVNLAEDEVVLHEDPATIVWMRSLKRGESLQDASVALLLGSAYGSEKQALDAGIHWRGVLERTYAALGIAADFGDYAAKGVGLTPAFLEQLRETTAQVVINEVHGLMVLPDDVTAVAISGNARGRAGTPSERFLQALSAAMGAPEFDFRERLAYDIYSAAAFVGDFPVARFMMLMMALETLIQAGERDDVSQAHIDRLIEDTDHATLAQHAKESLQNALRGLKRESVRSAGRRLVVELGGRTYDGMTPTQFFGRCYTIRSALSHGATNRPDRDLVGRTAAQLDVFVGHLIAGKTLIDELFPVVAAQ